MNADRERAANAWDDIAERLENGEDPKYVAMRCRALAMIERADDDAVRSVVKVLENMPA